MITTDPLGNIEHAARALLWQAERKVTLAEAYDFVGKVAALVDLQLTRERRARAAEYVEYYCRKH